MSHVVKKPVCPPPHVVHSHSPEPAMVRRVRQFVTDNNSCCRRACLRRFQDEFPDELWQFGEDIATCSRKVKETALLMNLRDHLSLPCQSLGQSAPSVAFVLPIPSRLLGACVVRRMRFCGIMGCWTLQTLLTYLKSHGNSICPRTHGLTGKPSNHGLSSRIQQQVIDWILELGEHVGEDDEGRQGRRERHHVEGRVVRFLPASVTIAGLYRLVVKEHATTTSPAGGSSPPISFSAFRVVVVVSEPCQHIRLRHPEAMCVMNARCIGRFTDIIRQETPRTRR